MLCDELKSLWVYGRDIEENCDEEFVNFAKENGYEELVEKKEVIEAIAEIKEFAENACLERDDNQTAIDELQSENRKLKRRLWLARAERAADRARIFYFNDLQTMLDIDGYSYDSKKKKGHKKLTARSWRIIWEKVERKCRAKAEAY